MAKPGAILKKINARAKALKKLHPGTLYRTLQKRAAKEVSGVKKTVSKRPKAAKKLKKKAATKRNGQPELVERTRVVYKVFRPKRKGKSNKAHFEVIRNKAVTGIKKKSKKKSKVSGTGSKLLVPALVIGGIGIAAYLLLRNRSATAVQPVSTALQQTGDPVRDSKAAEIMAWAGAAGLAAGAIADIISALNSSRSKTDAAYSELQSGGNPLNAISGVQTPYLEY